MEEIVAIMDGEVKTMQVETKEDDVSNLTLRQKLARIRAEFSEASIKKSGVNNYGGFMFFELGDIVPIALKLFLKYDVTLDFHMGTENVKGALYDNTHDVEPIVYEFPKKSLDLDKSKTKMNVIQAIGSEITYYRRYLYLIVLDIAENDSIDCAEQTQNTAKIDRNKAKKELTNTDAPADELQVEALKTALKRLREKDSEYEEDIKTIALKTKGFTQITKKECEDLIIKIGGILNGNSNMAGQTSTASNTNSKA